MKKVEILLTVALVIVGVAEASFAEGWYMRFGGGYNLGIGNQWVGAQYTPEDTWTKDVLFNAGQGFPIVVDAGFDLNENFALEFACGYTIGIESEKSQPSWAPINYDTESLAFKGQIIPITVALKYKFTLGAIKPYFSVGTGVYIGTIVERYNNKQTNTAGEVTYYGTNLGVNFSLGIEYPFSDLISIFGEAKFDIVEFTPIKKEVTAYTINGVDKLSTLTPNQKHLCPWTGGPPWLMTGSFYSFPTHTISARGGISFHF